MFVPKKSKYIHLPSCAYKGRKPLPYYVCKIGKPAKYLLLEVLNTTTFSDDEIISFCVKCKKNGLGLINVQKCLYMACIESKKHYEEVDKFITTIISKWNIK